MKNLKYLFVIALAFFMVYDPVNAEVAGSICTNETCSISIERVSEDDALVIDPEILTLQEGEVLYAVSVTTEDSFTPEKLLFRIQNSFYVVGGDEGISYVSTDLSKTPDIRVSVLDGVGTTISQDYVREGVIGYLIVEEGYADGEFSAEFVEYSSHNASEVVLNGIKYENGEDNYAINTDVLFGDFTFNYVIGNDPYGNSYGYWEAVNANSDKIVVDASDSMSDVYCDFSFVPISKVDMWFSEYGGPLAGDEGYFDENLNNRTFRVEAGKKETIRAHLTGGNEDIAKEILQGDRKIGFISLFITNDPNQL